MDESLIGKKDGPVKAPPIGSELPIGPTRQEKNREPTETTAPTKLSVIQEFDVEDGR